MRPTLVRVMALIDTDWLEVPSLHLTITGVQCDLWPLMSSITGQEGEKQAIKAVCTSLGGGGSQWSIDASWEWVSSCASVGRRAVSSLLDMQTLCFWSIKLCVQGWGNLHTCKALSFGLRRQWRSSFTKVTNQAKLFHASDLIDVAGCSHWVRALFQVSWLS